MNEKEPMYYIECVSSAATRIGKQMIMPNKPPLALTEKQYNAHKRQIDFYVNKGVIMVAAPGTKESARAADIVKEEEKRLDSIVAGGELPPAPLMRRLGFSTPPESVPPVVPEIPSFSSPSESNYVQCVAVTAMGSRCKNEALPDAVVCKIHMGMLGRGKDVFDEDGNRIANDGRSIET